MLIANDFSLDIPVHEELGLGLIFNYQITNLLNYQILQDTGRPASQRAQNSRNLRHNNVMPRTISILGSAVFLVIAPGLVAVYVPWRISRWHFEPALLNFSEFRAIGVVMIAAGLPVLLDSFARFAIQGLGTPAPVAPPQRLVVTGLYRYVRNPMYVGVSSLIFGQGLLFGSTRILEYGAVVWAAFFLFVLLYEEPVLRSKFGDEYREFCAHVPRWIPRLKPWRKSPAADPG